MTVGTTSFPSLVSACASPAVLRAVRAAGWSRVLVQHGRGAAPDARDFPDSMTFVRNYAAFAFKADVRGDVAAAALVVSHAGAGSAFEALRAGKRLVLVVNEALADNHQLELARALAAGGHAHVVTGAVTPDALARAIAAAAAAPLVPMPPPDLTGFVRVADALCGFTGAVEEATADAAGAAAAATRGVTGMRARSARGAR